MMAERWMMYWCLAKYGKLMKTERAPKRKGRKTFSADIPAAFYFAHTGETRKFNATSEENRMVKRREIVRELIPSSK
jgi:hypothetical protein